MVDKIVALIEEILRGGGSRFKGSIRYLTKYFCPTKDVREFGHVKLRSITLVGYMEMGKTEMAKYLIELSQRHFNKMGIGNIAFTGKTIVDIMYYIGDNKDLVRGNNVVYVFVDDLFYGGMSTERSRGKRLGEKIYSDIRHWPERIGVKTGIIYVLFGAQRFSLIPVFFRNTPFLLFKGLAIQGRYEKQTIKDVLTSCDKKNAYVDKLADIFIDILETITHLAYVEYREDVKAITVVKPLRKKPYIFVQPRLANPDMIEVPFNYSGVFDEEEEDIEKRMTREEKQYLIKYVVAAIKIGMTIRDTGIHSLSATDIKKILRQVLGISFNNNDLHELFKDTLPIDNNELKKFLETKLAKTIPIPRS